MAAFAWNWRRAAALPLATLEAALLRAVQHSGVPRAEAVA